MSPVILLLRVNKERRQVSKLEQKKLSHGRLSEGQARERVDTRFQGKTTTSECGTVSQGELDTITSHVIRKRSPSNGGTWELL